MLRAGEIILKTSDPRKIDMRYEADGFVALRKYMVYAVVATAIGQEKWQLQAKPRDKAVEAALTISEAGTTYGSFSATNYEAGMKSIPLYRLIWKRMDYILGRREDWVSCDEEEMDLSKSNTSPLALGGLCGATSAGRDASAPESLGKPPVIAAPGFGKPKRGGGTAAIAGK